MTAFFLPSINIKAKLTGLVEIVIMGGPGRPGLCLDPLATCPIPQRMELIELGDESQASGGVAGL